MKVLKSNATEDTTGGDECDILRTLRDTNPKAPGYRHICHLIDDFVHEGPNGPHICIVTELMGPTVMDCYRCVPGAMPLYFVKRLARQMLLALQYMHDECHLVHTGTYHAVRVAHNATSALLMRMQTSRGTTSSCEAHLHPLIHWPRNLRRTSSCPPHSS